MISLYYNQTHSTVDDRLYLEEVEATITSLSVPVTAGNLIKLDYSFSIDVSTEWSFFFDVELWKKQDDGTDEVILSRGYMLPSGTYAAFTCSDTFIDTAGITGDSLYSVKFFMPYPDWTVIENVHINAMVFE